MKFLLFLKTKAFRKNLLIAIASIALFLYLLVKWLNVYTRHGQSITVPDLRGLSLEQATALLEEKDFRYEVDSMYNAKMSKGVVIEQEPDANIQVKENRTIYITIVSKVAPSVKLPDLIDVSLREAVAIVESYGLKVRQLIYKPDLAQNAVLGIQYEGKEIKKGFKLPKGAEIDLVLGDGFGNLQVNIPNLIGLTYDEALFVLQGSKLLIGAVEFDGAVKDTFNTKVFRQSPEFTTDTTRNKISQGEAIDIYLREE